MKEKRSPFDYIKSIYNKQYIEDLQGFVPYLTAINLSAGNRHQCFIANSLNKIGQHKLPKLMFYDFYFYGTPKFKGWIKYPKKEKELKSIEYLQEWFACDEQSAKTALSIIDNDELYVIIDHYENRGFKK